MNKPKRSLTNPFIYGKSISDPDQFIGRDEEIGWLYDLVSKGSCCAIVGELRMGKTSLLSMLSHPKTMQRFRASPDYLLPVYISLDAIKKSTTPEQMVNIFFMKIKHGLSKAKASAGTDLLPTPEPSDPYGDLERLLAYLDRRVVLLLDEFEALVCNPNLHESFYAHLRFLASNRPLALITASRVSLSELFPLKSFVSSPFWNIFVSIYLQPFSVEEAHQLIAYAIQGAPFSFRASEIEYLMEIAGRHPHLLQVASYFLFQAYSYGLDRAARQKYLYRRFYQEAAPHFSYLWEHSTDDQKITLTALALLSEQKQAGKYGMSVHKLQQYIGGAERVLFELMNRGLVTSQDDQYLLFSSTFASWIVREIKASLTEPREYEDWLRSREAQGSILKLSKHLVDEVKTEVLPQIAVKYRELVIAWLSDPRTISSATALLRSAFGQQ